MKKIKKLQEETIQSKEIRTTKKTRKKNKKTEQETR